MTMNNPINPNNMRQELRFFRTAHSIEIEADGKVIATIPMCDKDEEQQVNEPDEPKAIICDFKTWNPQVTKSRLVEPTMDTWAVLHGVSENRQSINSPENVSNPEGILTLWNRQKTAVIEGETMTVTTACVYSQKLFGKGRIDIRANLACAMDTKNTIWATTSPMTDPRSGLKYLFEFDIALDTGGLDVLGSLLDGIERGVRPIDLMVELALMTIVIVDLTP